MDTPWPTAWLIGLISSVHCIGMCGGISGMLTYALPAPIRQQPRAFFLALLTQNIGRITSYALAGLIAGGIGQSLWWTLSPRMAHALPQLLSAIVLVLLGLYLAGLFPGIALLENLGSRIWRMFEPITRKLLPIRSTSGLFTLGMIWGWFPCGLVYAVLLWTLSFGNPVKGMILMTAFGLGTLPGVLLQGLFAGRLGGWIRHPQLMLLTGMIVLAVGLFSLYRLWHVEPICLPLITYSECMAP
ncbi:MAG: sulfite exporter TauE/SafE family protein [Magnetococcales bacterium]|nr:sulfite exporter TauE/SafE family protein [Magnetococcales bacterium]